ncbi:zinc uptake protein ZrgA [Roseovarius sp.]|uniref:zinc uptake protein ZrgA n=1 Tax=Roseovarius sp. TaxID=1486281 RepID=UPI003BA856F2
MKRTTLAIFAATMATPAVAEETRGMGAHVHGVSTVEIAVEDGVLELDLRAPGMDIVGFEHEATSPGDKDAVEDAIRVFLSPEDIVTLPEGAGCRLTEVLAHLHSGGDDHGHDHGRAGEEGHDHDHGEGEDHDHEHEHEEGGDHDHDSEHVHADGEDHAHDRGAGHSEFHVRYRFTCEDGAALTSVGFPMFGQFENAGKIEVQYVTGTGAGAAELTRGSAVLTFE